MCGGPQSAGAPVPPNMFEHWLIRPWLFRAADKHIVTEPSKKVHTLQCVLCGDNLDSREASSEDFLAMACPGALIGAKNERLIIEDEFLRTESGVGFLGWGSKPTPHQLGSLGERSELSPHRPKVSTIFSSQDMGARRIFSRGRQMVN